MATIKIPDPKRVYSGILNIETPAAHDKSVTKTIQGWTKHVVKRQKEKLRQNQIEKFISFSIDLLTAAVKSGEWKLNLEEWLKEKLTSLDNLPSEDDFLSVLEDVGYRFPARGAKKLIRTAEILMDYFNGEWESYFKKAKKFPYLEDPFLTIEHVGRKVRDLALSGFILEYPTVDVHVARVLRRTGLVCHCYSMDIELHTSPEDGYEELSRLCVELSKKVSVKPAQFDRALWHFGRSVCRKRNPGCDWCPIRKICLNVVAR